MDLMQQICVHLRLSAVRFLQTHTTQQNLFPELSFNTHFSEVWRKTIIIAAFPKLPSYTLCRVAGRAVPSGMRLEAQGGALGRFSDMRTFF